MQVQQIAAALQATEAALIESGVHKDLWATLAPSVFSSVLGNERTARQERGASNDRVDTHPPATLGLMAEKIGCDQDLLSDHIDVDGDAKTLSLTTPTSKVYESKAAATRQVLLLVVSARLLARIDDDVVDSSHVREALEEYGKYDTSNYATHVKKLDDLVSVTTTGGRTSYKLRRPGMEAAINEWRSVVGL